jgi:flagellar protein FlaI
MATDDADGAVSGQLEGAVDPGGGGDRSEPAVVGDYSWADYLSEYGASGDAEALYEEVESMPGTGRWDDGSARPTADDWARVSTDPSRDLGFHPTEIDAVVGEAGRTAADLQGRIYEEYDLEDLPCTKGIYGVDEFEREHGSSVAETLGVDPSEMAGRIAGATDVAGELADLVDEHTVDVDEEIDEDAFFTTDHGTTTVVNRYDLEKAVPTEKKRHFREVDRYWVNDPHAFVIIFHSTKENEKKYYVIEPYMNSIEDDLAEFLTGKLRTAIKYSDESVVGGDVDNRLDVIEDQTLSLLDRYDLYERTGAPVGSLRERDGQASNGAATDDGSGGFLAEFKHQLGMNGSAGGNGTPDDASAGFLDRLLGTVGWGRQQEVDGDLDGMSVRPEPVVLEEDPDDLNDYQVDKLLYYLKRDFIGYERIDGIKHDINVEDISCDGYNSPVFVYHSEYEQIISNIYHDEDELDDFVVKLAQRSGKGISKRRPQVDATLPDGSRAQLTLGKEVSDHGTNYTIRQFKDVPFTPIDLINWNTFSLEEMAFLWLCIENHKSLIFAGGTASGKTTSLNAVSLFIPSNAKIVSIEDTREVELPQRNWIASVTRPSFSDDDKGDVDEFDLLEAALRQRPDYIVMGEIRGEEGRTLFQVMSTGHTTYTTFHADSVGEVLKRFTTDPINVSKTMFTALDLVSIQTSTRVEGNKVRRNKVLTEINHYDAENDEINVQDVYQWQAETDEFLKMGTSNTLEGIQFDRGWERERLDLELFKRRVVLAYLIDRDLNTYTQVAATFQAFINDQDTILALIARDTLEDRLEDLREMESVLIDIEQEKEEMVPRPETGENVGQLAEEILAEAREELLPEYEDMEIEGLESALAVVEDEEDVVASEQGHQELEDTVEAARQALGTPDDDVELEGDEEVEALAAGNTSPSDTTANDGQSAGAASVDASADATQTGRTPDVETDESFTFGGDQSDDGQPAAAGGAGAGADSVDGTASASSGTSESPADAGAASVGSGANDDESVVEESADAVGPASEAGSTGERNTEPGSPADAADVTEGEGLSTEQPDDGSEPSRADESGWNREGDATGGATEDVDDWGFGGFTGAEPEEE